MTCIPLPEFHPPAKQNITTFIIFRRNIYYERKIILTVCKSLISGDFPIRSDYVHVFKIQNVLLDTSKTVLTNRAQNPTKTQSFIELFFQKAL